MTQMNFFLPPLTYLKSFLSLFTPPVNTEVLSPTYINKLLTLNLIVINEDS